jgi:hypothetical protein
MVIRLSQAALQRACGFALPTGGPDYKRSSGVPLLRCSVQDF